MSEKITKFTKENRNNKSNKIQLDILNLENNGLPVVPKFVKTETPVVTLLPEVLLITPCVEAGATFFNNEPVSACVTNEPVSSDLTNGMSPPEPSLLLIWLLLWRPPHY